MVMAVSLVRQLRNRNKELRSDNSEAIKAVVRLAGACVVGAIGVLVFIASAVSDLSIYALDSVSTFRGPEAYTGVYVAPAHALSFAEIFLYPWLGTMCAVPFVAAKQSRDLLRALVPRARSNQ